MTRSIDTLEMSESRELVQEILDKKMGLNDTDWRDMVEQHNLDCSPDTLRKAGVGVKLAADAGMRFGADSSDSHAVDDNYVERQKLYDLRRDVNVTLRQESRSELLREMIRDAIAKLPELPKTKPVEMTRQDAASAVVLAVGDFHYGADFDVCGLRGESLNRYNSIVFEERMNQLIAEAKWICYRERPLEVVVMNVGDALDGLLRASQISRLEYGAVESAIRLGAFLTDWLIRLQDTVDVPVTYCAVRGNHGEIRPLGSKAGQFPEENLERVVNYFLYERFRNSEMISIWNEDAPLYEVVDVCGYRFLMLHGHGQDIEQMANSYKALYDENIDCFVCGHLHKSQTFLSGMGARGKVIIERVPSLCGIDPYAQSKGYGAPAGAVAMVIEEGYGRRCVYPIELK